MKHFFICLIGILVLLTYSCSPPKTIEGHWKMTRITNDGVDVSSEHNPQNDRWIELNADHTFVSDGTPFGRNTGRWSITKEGWLWLDSDAGEADDSYWTYNISGNEMRWQGQKFEFSKHFVIEHIRTDNPSE